jgi:phage replication O-like protein O
MANPQRENGHIEIATEIWENLCLIRIPGESRQILDFVIRKTYGWHKKEDRIPLSQFTDGTGLKKSTVCKATAKLKQMNLITITQKGNDYINTYGFNKDFETWKPLPKKVTPLPKKTMQQIPSKTGSVTQKGNEVSLPKKVTTITQKGNEPLPKKGTSIDTTKDTQSKDITPSEQSSPDPVQLVMAAFYETINPTINFGNKTNRNHARMLVAKFGLQETLELVRCAAVTQSMPFAPSITTPYLLWVKYAQLKSFVAKESGKINEWKSIKI